MDTHNAVRTFTKPFTFFTFHKYSISPNETIFFFQISKEEKLEKAIKMNKGGRLMTDHLILVIFVFICVAFAAVRSF